MGELDGSNNNKAIVPMAVGQFCKLFEEDLEEKIIEKTLTKTSKVADKFYLSQFLKKQKHGVCQTLTMD